MCHTTVYVNRASYVLQNEGIISLLRMIFSYLCSRIFLYKEYYVRQHFVGELKEADFMPDVRDFTFKLITSNEMADDWATQTGFDFRNQILHARQRLAAGAVAFCIFIENELAHINWVGLNQKAKDTINTEPYKVNFSNHEGCTGGAVTAPKYRGKGLMGYSCFCRNSYMKQQGITMLIGIDETDNVAIYKVQSKFPTKIYAKARYIKFLWWQYWKETPLPEGFQPAIVSR